MNNGGHKKTCPPYLTEPAAPSALSSLRGNMSLEPNGTACKRAVARPKPRAIGSARHYQAWAHRILRVKLDFLFLT